MIVSGSVQANISLMNLKVKAQKKIKENAPSKEEGIIAKLNEQTKDMAKTNALASIIMKLKMGKRLSDAEKQYLKKHAPEDYAKYKLIEAERNHHGRQLDRTKTKKEAALLHVSKICQFVDDHRAGPACASSESQEYRAAALKDEYDQYMARGKKRHRANDANDRQADNRLQKGYKTEKTGITDRTGKPAKQNARKKAADSVAEAQRKRALAAYNTAAAGKWV